MSNFKPVPNKIWVDMVDNKSIAQFRYNDEYINFNVMYFNKGHRGAAIKTAPSPFAEFNEWLKTKPQEWHSQVFGIYKKIKDDINEINNVDYLLRTLNNHFREIYSMISLDEIKEWIRLPNTPVHITIKPNEAYDQKTTYDYTDYLELVSFSLALRFIAPIWGHIDKRVDSEYGRDTSTTYLLELLHGTCMMSDSTLGINCVAENRLRDFIYNINMVVDTNAVLVYGLSEEDYYYQLYCSTILRKICQGDISGADGHYSLIAKTYSYLDSRAKSSGKSYGSGGVQIQMKKNPKDDYSGGDDSNSQSVLDVGFVRARVLPNESIFMVRGAKDHERLIEILCPDLPRELYWESMDTIEQMNTNNHHFSFDREKMVPIQPVQLTLAKWVISKAINPLVFDYMELDEMIRLIGLLRAILWYQGHHEFAAILSAIALPFVSDFAMPSTTYRDNLEPALNDELSKVYDLAGNTKSEKSNMSYKGCIETMNSQLKDFTWYLTLPDKWLEESHLVHKDRRMIIPSNIRNKISRLMLSIEKQQEVQETSIFD